MSRIEEIHRAACSYPNRVNKCYLNAFTDPVDIMQQVGAVVCSDTDTESAIFTAFMDGAVWADNNPVNMWHSVDDELPRTKDEVWADVEFDTGYGIAHDYCIAHFIDGQWYTREKQPINVVKWQPLPKNSPKKQ